MSGEFLNVGGRCGWSVPASAPMLQPSQAGARRAPRSVILAAQQIAELPDRTFALN